MKKSTTIALVALLLVGVMIPQTLAATSEGLFYRMSNGDRFYFTLEFEENGVDTLSEVFYIEIENASKPIPDPLTNLTHLDYIDVDFAFENGSSMGLLPIIFLGAPQLVYPVGNWELIHSLATADLQSSILFDAYDLSIDQDGNYWGFSYKFEDTGDTEGSVWVDYSKFDGMFSYYRIAIHNTTTSELLMSYEASRISQHNFEWGCYDSQEFYFHLSMIGSDFGFHDVEEDFYLKIGDEGLPVIPYVMTEWSDIPYIGGNLFWVNDTIFFDPILSYSWRVAVPIGNWSLLDDFIDDLTLPADLTLDDPDIWFWGYSWSDSMGDIEIAVHTDYLKVDGVVAHHSAVFTNTTSSTVVGRIDIERLNIERYTDRSAPVINHPYDIEFIEGAENKTILWGLIDENPTNYTITVNGTVVDSGTWISGDAIALELDDFEVGVYDCVITAYDIAGNSASDSVIVTVTAAGGIANLIMDNILYIAIGAGVIILIGAIVILRRK